MIPLYLRETIHGVIAWIGILSADSSRFGFGNLLVPSLKRRYLVCLHAPKCVSRRESSPSLRDTTCSEERRAIKGVWPQRQSLFQPMGIVNRRIAKKIGNDPGRSGYREILCVAGPTEHFVGVGKKCRQPYQQREADQHQCE
jgi:hypothetical protein